MAKAPKPPKATTGGQTGGNRSLVWLSGLACGVMTAIAPGITTLAAGLLLPGIIAFRFDEVSGRPVARAVLLCGAAACAQPVAALWHLGQSFDAAFSIVSDPGMLGPAWGAAAAGWLATQIAPLAVRVFLDMAAVTRTARLRARRARLAELWGLDDAPPPDRE